MITKKSFSQFFCLISTEEKKIKKSTNQKSLIEKNIQRRTKYICKACVNSVEARVNDTSTSGGHFEGNKTLECPDTTKIIHLETSHDALSTFPSVS